METSRAEKFSKGIDKFKKQLKDLGPSDIVVFLKENQISVMVFFILALAFFFRLWQLGSVPGGVSASENLVISKIASLKWSNMWLDGGYTNAAYIYLGYLWTELFGLTVFNLRVMSALIGSGTVVLSYLFISKWFSRKIAIFMALLFAISSFHVTVSRLILPEVMLPFILLALFVCLTYAYRSKNIWLFGLCGVIAGVGFYASQAFIIIPAVLLVSGVYFVSKNKKFFTSYRNEVVVSAAGFAGVIIPYLVSFVNNRDLYSSMWEFTDSWSQFAINFSQVPQMLFLGSSSNFFLNVGTEPLLDPLIFVTSVFGFFFAVFALGRRKYFFIIFWLLLFYIYAAAKESVSAVDLLGLLPVVYTLAALILDYVIEHWFATFPLNRHAKTFAIGLISIFFALSVLYNFDRYFVAYKNSDQVQQEFSKSSRIPLNR